ncbi:TPA: restriction endonuclease subunit S [Klebsiella pneumoniae]|uniref:restriction endonuclease subunit S n=1 Tax=Klebsiella pneumoniae TaxID=573 RepID=UPI000DE6E7A9|nr:restriction endonuclease subunit S [Klebsiella pneumoniae]EKW1254086.1 restriction endonuclease subunit S [Klebsiella pneumoniae]MCJ8601252.1 restriction endonuclease subunit S [Klebsiella pneumoniae]MCQ8599225.1 restriction endonuclease subunit S [Klebsiella pneumoniae]SSL69553.1 restriction modification system DNA specificity domain-containing protein [Klebsiella pneumoniae]HBQ3898568.1 restriction endonuclease subunit S [Klebsiella pneumoniae]
MYSRVNSNLLEDRLDAEFYSLEQIKNHKTLQDYGVIPLSAYCNGINVGYTGELTSVYSAQGTTLFRVSDIDGIFLSNDDVKYVPDDFAANNPQIWIRDNDIVFAAVGNTIGKVALKTVSMPDGVCSRALMIARPLTDKIDSSFLIAYLATKYAQKSLLRGVSGSAQPVLNTPLIANLPVISAEAVSQKYIGDKVRQAEQLRVWAKRLENRVQSFHSQFIPDQLNLDFGKKTRNVSSDRMTERLDAHFYPGVVEQYLNTHPHKFESLNALTTVIYNGQTQPESFEDFCEQITVANLSASFIKGQPRKVSSPSKVDKFIKAHDILMCNAAHNKSYIGRELTYVHTDKKLLPSTEVMTIRVNRDLLPASYVRTYLLSRLGYVKVQSTIRGITAHSYPDDVALLDIYIPEVESNQKQEWFKQDELLVQAGCAVEFSQKLTSCAKILVEALIEGQMTEHQLIQAQQALEDGDNSFDQAILSKLSAEGYAIEGATPLFSDVDELYSLLEEAAQAEAEE